ncbi:Chromate resistance protein ChrB [Herbiconiux sp. KACC 21604]|uniref:Chromate resistance protein ChrB n=1 Tax=unclassified Herbiconiux TaxID=2618217 RepID=UPI0020A28F78|nr:Chromate resistance protein ChrB [Herbiconiux sp. SALV-R1]WPO87071.1 Chromate resistance protein ChrB [Herbiconiux sp. KACC 21604]
MTDVTLFSWLLLIPRVPAQPTKHRVAVWRELRRMGAVPAASGAWAVPELPAFTEHLDAVRALAERADGGGLTVLQVSGRSDADTATLRDAFAAARVDEWAEFVADCGKFDDEIDREIAKQKFTFGELEEEEQSLERLRRWHRDLLRRDALALPEATAATERLAACTDKLAGYAERVFEANVPSDPAP